MEKESISSQNFRPSTQFRQSRISLSSTYIKTSSSCGIPNKRRDIHSSLRASADVYTFGKGSPKWTIPSSRPQKSPQLQSPGPGQYEVLSPLIDNKRIYSRMSLMSQEKSRPPLTASIGFIDRPSLVNVKSAIVIGKREKIDFVEPKPGPGPGHYSPISSLNTKSHIIASRHEIDHSGETPGPGAYDVQNSNSSIKGTSLPNASIDRTQWMKDGIEMTPGPSEYSLKSNESKQHQNKRSKSKKIIVAIDRCIIKLDKTDDADEAKKYLQSNKKLKVLINEIYETVLNSKPKEPLQFLKEYFLPEAFIPTPMEEEEDFLLY